MDYVDFHHVEPHQAGIHDDLQNWARWCYSRPTHWIQPMFRAYRSAAKHWYGEQARIEVDTISAQAMEKAVSALPESHRDAIRWCYVFRTAPRAAAQDIGCSLLMLQKYVRDGRQMLMNRNAGSISLDASHANRV